MINKKRIVQTFIDLVKIDSVSGEEKNVAKKVAIRLKKLGAKVEFDSYGNVIGKLKGKGEPLLLNAHLDTVEPGRGIKPIIKGERITSDGSTVLGGDPKAGIAAILEALKSLQEDKKPHVPLEIVFTKEEEIGLRGAVNLDYTKLKAKRGITFDGEEAVHNITISAPGYNRIDVTIVGRGAHAGCEPEKGISAIVIASLIIGKLKLGRIDEETTANIGMISGGSARNAIPELVHIKAEIRSRNRKKLEEHTKHFEKMFAKTASAFPESKIEVVVEREFESYLFKKNHRVIAHAHKILSDFKLIPNLCHTGGGTDVNIFHTKGIEGIVVGGGFYNAHTKREYVVISEMLQAAQFCEKMVLV